MSPIKLKKKKKIKNEIILSQKDFDSQGEMTENEKNIIEDKILNYIEKLPDLKSIHPKQISVLAHGKLLYKSDFIL